MSDAMAVEVFKAFMGVFTSILTAILVYFVGWYLAGRFGEQRRKAELAIVQATQNAQKQRELQLLAANRFYQLYGEFFAVWKLWTAFKSGKVPAAPEVRRELYQRICAAEGEMESILVRVATEFRLGPTDIALLAKFRQAYQCLREAIRADQELAWYSSSHPAYAAFKRLACSVASLLIRPSALDLPQTDESVAALLKITDNNWEGDWIK